MPRATRKKPLPPPQMDETDFFDLLWTHTKRYKGELELEKVFQGWKVTVLCPNKPEKSGVAKGRNVLDCSKELCAKFGLVK